MPIVAYDQRVAKHIAMWLLVTSLGCASHQSVAREPCALRTEDAVFAATGDVFRDCAVDRPARLSTKEIHPDWKQTPGHNECVSVDMEFVVDTTGKPETVTARAVRTSDSTFADAYLATLKQWRYEPAQRAGTKVRQIVTEHRMAQTGKVPFVLVGPGSLRPTPRPPAGGPTC